MQFQTDGLVVREMTVGESDRLIWVLTRDRGMIRAFARRAKIYKNSLHAATQLLCYGHFKVSENKDRCLIMEGQPIEIFFELRQDLTRLSLAQYFCELAGILAVDGQGAGEILRLVLNALHFLCKGARPPLILKAAVELRMLSIAGFMPDLVGCAECGAYTAETMVFFPREGNLVCGNCHPPAGGIALSAGCLPPCGILFILILKNYSRLHSGKIPSGSWRAPANGMCSAPFRKACPRWIFSTA